jgi:hypothetical protein
MVRVVGPRGRLVIADTDWRSLTFDLIAPDSVTQALRAFSRPWPMTSVADC